ncbi:hypothetical protein SY88_17855 [Clostridiales bacterium PH28_bin88]|nr:hypothetical protein SY88_17855 [Clostridiales bacterium PH28_bin88]
MDKLVENEVDLVIFDAGEENTNIFPIVKTTYPDLVGIVLTPHPDDEYAKPANQEQLVMAVKFALETIRLRQENKRLRQELQRAYSFGSLVSSNVRMQEIFHLLARVAATDATVLIQGESGTGSPG